MSHSLKPNQLFINNFDLLTNLNPSNKSQRFSEKKFKNPSVTNSTTLTNSYDKFNTHQTLIDQGKYHPQNSKERSHNSTKELNRTGSNKLVQKKFQVAYSQKLLLQSIGPQQQLYLSKSTINFQDKSLYNTPAKQKNLKNLNYQSSENLQNLLQIESLRKQNRFKITDRGQQLLRLNSKRNSKQESPKKHNEQKVRTPQKQQKKQENQVKQLYENNFLGKKMLNLENKSNKLLEKVLSIQQQIQKYSQTQQKDMSSYDDNFSTLLFQTRSHIQQHKQEQKFNAFIKQQKHGIKKLNILGKTKVKMIQNLQNKIESLQNKLIKKQNVQNQIISKRSQQLDEVKKQIYGNFVNYYKYKDDVLKQSKSQKFSFNKLRFLKSQSKITKNDIYDQIRSKNQQNKFQQSKNQQDLQKQLDLLKQQFSSYKQRTSKQLQNYKQKLNENTLQKQLLKKQLDELKYEHLKQKIFSKKNITTKRQNLQKTSRQFYTPKQQFNFNQSSSKQELQPQLTNFNDFKILQLNIPKTQRPIFDQQMRFRDLDQLRDQLSVKYIQDNQVEQELNRKIKSLEEIISSLQQKIQKTKSQHDDQIMGLKLALEQKQKLQEQLVEMNQEKDRQLQEVKNQMNDMNNYILQCKQQNQHQNEALQEYKTVIEQFILEVNNLRSQLNQKNHIIEQLHEQINEASKINQSCQKQIQRLELQHQKAQDLKNKLSSKNQQLNQKIKKVQNESLLLKRQNSMRQSNKEDQNSFFLLQRQIAQLKEKQNRYLRQLQNKSKTIQLINQQLKKQIQNKQKSIICTKSEYLNELKHKQTQIQQLSQTIQGLKSSISDKVDQQVNQGIRTFLRYRKHVNHIVHQTIKLNVISQKQLQKKHQQNQLVDLRFNDIKINNKINKILTDRQKQYQNGFCLNLRKILDSKFKFKFNQGRYESSNLAQQMADLNHIRFKIQICLKLIKFAIDLLAQSQSACDISAKSLKPSNKKYLSLYPQNIYLIQNQNISQFNSTLQTPLKAGFEQNIQTVYNNFQNYQFIYKKGQKRDEQNKSDKSLIYLSPQVLLSMNESQFSYCWTLGIIFDQIFNHRPYYHKIQDIISRKQNYKYQNKIEYSEGVNLQAKLILQKMIRKNHKQRPNLQSIQQKFNILKNDCM